MKVRPKSNIITNISERFKYYFHKRSLKSQIVRYRWKVGQFKIVSLISAMKRQTQNVLYNDRRSICDVAVNNLKKMVIWRPMILLIEVNQIKSLLYNKTFRINGDTYIYNYEDIFQNCGWCGTYTYDLKIHLIHTSILHCIR